MRICIIPARGGSKRIPKKNIRLFNGLPIIAWAIKLAIRSNLFSNIIVSTDDTEISDIAKSFGLEVPFLRPTHLSDDHTATAPVIAHAILECSKLGVFAESVTCIYPCSPLIQIEDLNLQEMPN